MEKQFSLSAEMNDFPYTDSMNLTHESMPTEQNFLTHSQQGAVDASNNPPASQVQPEAPGGAVQARKKGVSRRLKNFTIKEDEFLCSAYLNVSMDPIVGVNQPTGSYWSRMSAYFNEHKTTPYTRSLSSLQHRWGDIKKDTSRFCGFFAEVESRNQSSKSEDDKVKDALQMYEALAGSQYRFVHCWLMLRNEPKWNNLLASLPATTGGTPGQSEQPAKDPTLPPRMDRPVGRDKSKRQRSTSTTSSSSACLEVLQKMSTDRIAYEARLEAATEKEAREMASLSDRRLGVQEKQLKLQQEMLQLQKQDREDRLVNMDLEVLQKMSTDRIAYEARLEAATEKEANEMASLSDRRLAIQEKQLQLQQEILQLQKQDRVDRLMNMDLEKMAPWVRHYYIKQQKEIAGFNDEDNTNE